MDFNDMNQINMDVLREIGNIGSGNATTALSQMMGEKIDMRVPNVNLYEFKDLADIVGGAENVVAGIMQSISGDIEGTMMFIVENKVAKHLVSKLMGASVKHQEGFSEMEMSALNEIGNIIISAYMSSISMLTNLKFSLSIPYICIDMAGAILSVPAIEFGKLGDKALLIQSHIGDDNVNFTIDGYFILIPTMESYNGIMRALGL